MRWILALVALTGCYPNRPDLPLVDEVPIVGSGSCRPPLFNQRVECIIDGDTLAIVSCNEEIGERIRLLGINAPEIAHEDAPAECWGYEAQMALTELLERKDVDLTFDVECEDVYSRTLAYAILPVDQASEILEDLDPEDREDLEADDGLLINEWLIAMGHARFYVPEGAPEPRLAARLQQAELVARTRGRGLWGACEGDPG